MSVVDLFIVAIRGLWRQRIRSSLTILGVAVGACALAFSVSLGIGLRHMIDDQHHKRTEFWRIEVIVSQHEQIPESEIKPEQLNIPEGIGEDRRARIRTKLINEYQSRSFAKGLDDEQLAELMKIPDVIDIVASQQFQVTIGLKGNKTNSTVFTNPLNRLEIASRIIAGSMPESDDADDVLVSESLLYDLGVRTDAELAAIIGKSLELTLGQPSIPFIKPARGDFRIAGVYRELSKAELSDAGNMLSRSRWAQVMMPAKSGRRFWLRGAGNQSVGYWNFTVFIRPGGDLRAVSKQFEQRKLQPFSMLAAYDSVKTEVTLIAAGLNLFAMISVLIAALGIANTLATSVVERTREIGILKAVGATRGQVLLLFLSEGTVIGLLGGTFGLLAAWLITFPADRFVANLIDQVSMGRLKVTTVFEFPVWLAPTTLVFATIVTTLAALLPARRAAKMEPIAALRSL